MTMIAIEELRKRRFQFLNLLYEKTNGDRYTRVSMWDLGNELGYEKNETQSITQYLEGEGLMEYAAIGGVIAITHLGITEVEEALSHPEQPTNYFPPVNIINIHHMESSQIQQGTIAGYLIGSFAVTNMGDLAEFIKLLSQKLPELRLVTGNDAEIRADITTIESQMKSSRPKNVILRESILSIKRILEGAGGAIVAHQLLPYIPILLEALR